MQQYYISWVTTGTISFFSSIYIITNSDEWVCLELLKNVKILFINYEVPIMWLITILNNFHLFMLLKNVLYNFMKNMKKVDIINNLVLY